MNEIIPPTLKSDIQLYKDMEGDSTGCSPDLRAVVNISSPDQCASFLRGEFGALGISPEQKLGQRVLANVAEIVRARAPQETLGAWSLVLCQMSQC